MAQKNFNKIQSAATKKTAPVKKLSIAAAGKHSHKLITKWAKEDKSKLTNYNAPTKKTGILEGKAKVTFKSDFKMTEKEFLGIYLNTNINDYSKINSNYLFRPFPGFISF